MVVEKERTDYSREGEDRWSERRRGQMVVEKERTDCSREGEYRL